MDKVKMIRTRPPQIKTEQVSKVHKKTPTLDREVFETSRALEYLSEKELRAQIGHGKAYWPICILKELIDNSLDACEGANISHDINVVAQDDHITVTDNGPGIPEHVIEKSLDYLVRVSNKAYYISPTRGQMGNALKVIYATSFVDTGRGYVEIAANGKLHHIEITLDRIAGKPKIKHTSKPHFIKNGTFIKIHYPNSSCLLNGESDSLLNEDDDDYYDLLTGYDLINRYVAFNPHATFTYNNAKYIVEKTVPLTTLGRNMTSNVKPRLPRSLVGQ
jgi:DNA topoisomerase VI subunit B